MTSFLELPRELYLIIAESLAPRDLSRLAAASRDHYLAAQQPLFAHITISGYTPLIELVRCLNKPPVVSRISALQRQRWHRLSDEQLRERSIESLTITLDREKDGHRIVGAVVSSCINAVVRKCYDAKIYLTIDAMSHQLIRQFDNFDLSNVLDFKMYCGEKQPSASKTWETVFSGSLFPDLRSVYVNTGCSRAEKTPKCLEDGSEYTEQDYPLRNRNRLPMNRFSPRTTEPEVPLVPFDGLRKLESITIEYSHQLTAPVLENLFGSSIIPERLTKLHIVNCPDLHVVAQLEAISMLLHRALPLMKDLKLHLSKLPERSNGFARTAGEYFAKIKKDPQLHLCSVVEELGKTIPMLDIALPFACYHLLAPAGWTAQMRHALEVKPFVQREPIETLPERLIKEGHKYRRVISWQALCCDSGIGWQELEELAEQDSSRASWELLFAREHRGSLHVSGYAPHKFAASEVLQRGRDIN